MKKSFDVAVVIGRFQPVHNGHLELFRHAAKIADNVLVIVGSAHQPRTIKNPFTVEDRVSMIEPCLRSLAVSRFSIVPNIDTIYNDAAWAVRVQEIVNNYLGKIDGTKVAIVGHKKDDTSFYLDMFPQWSFVDVGSVEPLDATSVRELFFAERMNMNFIRSVVPASTLAFLGAFATSSDYKHLLDEKSFIEGYKRQYASLPYAPVFVTADAVVIQSGHVLMIKRRSSPGKGLWALPGGFLNASTDRSVQDAAVRELREETGIKVPVPVLYGSIKDSKVFDAISRSSRGRTITHAFKFVLPDGQLPRVKGQDDAEKARWIPIASLRSEDCYEDHYEIISNLLGA
jgi:bifunctional NMN adenylyltransferase/nudix hydrolase